MVCFQPDLLCSQGQPQAPMEIEVRCWGAFLPWHPFKVAPRCSEDKPGQEEAPGKHRADGKADLGLGGVPVQA